MYVRAAWCDLCLVPALKVGVEKRCNGVRTPCATVFSRFADFCGDICHEPAAILRQVYYLPVGGQRSHDKDRTRVIPLIQSRANTSSRTVKFIVTRGYGPSISRRRSWRQIIFLNTSHYRELCKYAIDSRTFSVNKPFQTEGCFVFLYMYTSAATPIAWGMIIWKMKQDYVYKLRKQ